MIKTMQSKAIKIRNTFFLITYYMSFIGRPSQIIPRINKEMDTQDG